MRILGATPQYERRIRDTLSSFPGWYVEGARVSVIRVVNTSEVIKQVAVYSHESRDIALAPNVGILLSRCLSHELAHGVDDHQPFGSAHRFSRSREWMYAHRNASGFELPKYRDEPQEYFADMLSKYVLLMNGPVLGNALQRSHPLEYGYILHHVVPVLEREHTTRKAL